MTVTGSLKEGLEYINKALEIEPQSFAYHKIRIDCLSQLKDFKQTVKCCDEAFKLKSDDPQVYFVKGTSLLALNKPEEAISAFRKAKDLEPNNGQFGSILSLIEVKIYCFIIKN